MAARSACEAAGGVRRSGGYILLPPEQRCNLPTADGGKFCTDSKQCEAKLCIADLTPEEMEKARKGEPVGNKTGSCPRWRYSAGCLYPLQNGTVLGALCIDG